MPSLVNKPLDMTDQIYFLKVTIRQIQFNPDNSNSDNSNSPLTRTKFPFPWPKFRRSLPLFLEFPANSKCFPFRVWVTGVLLIFKDQRFLRIYPLECFETCIVKSLTWTHRRDIKNITMLDKFLVIRTEFCSMDLGVLNQLFPQQRLCSKNWVFTSW